MSESAPPDSARRETSAAPKRQLTLFDSTSIIVGIIIGAGIYESTPLIAGSLPGTGWLVAAWLLGGALSLVGALCYAELATAYPKEGGDYVYLTRAFGRVPGFLFAWSQLWVVRPGSIGAMAYVFARYANQLWPLSTYVARGYEAWILPAGASAATWPASARVGDSIAMILYAVISVMILSGINVLGVREGKWTQNLLTTVKVVGLVAIIVAGFSFATPDASPAPVLGDAIDSATAAAGAVGQVANEREFDLWGFLSQFGFAMIFVFYTYGGWNEMAYVGAEVRNPKKNILRALVLGTLAVTLIYALITMAFVHALGFDGVCESNAVAADVLKQWLGTWAAKAISLLICISALGSINGQIFTGARIYYAMGTDHRLYGRLGRWSNRFGTPVSSLVIQALITLALVVGFGWLQMVGRSEGGFESMVIFTSPVFWFFLVLVGLSVSELRMREPDRARPYRVLAYPVVPILFCMSSLFMLYSSLTYAVRNESWEALWSVVILLVGIGFCFCDPRPKNWTDNTDADG